jgi:DNA-binding transcriptional LysR family regulator
MPMSLKPDFGKYLGMPAGEIPRFVLECDDLRLICELAKKSNTVALVTDDAASHWIESGELKAVQVQGIPPLETSIGIITLRGRTLSPGAQLLLNRFRKVLLPASGGLVT